MNSKVVAHAHNSDAADILGFWLYIMTDCILFGTLFAVYLVEIYLCLNLTKLIVIGFPVTHPDLNLIPLKTNFENFMISFIKELWQFLKIRKKLWLAPIIIIMVLLGGILIAVEGTVVAPFVYTLF